MSRELTDRQLEIVTHLANGHRPHEIAIKLSLSISSVEKTIRSAKRNAGARTHAHLVAKVIASGLLSFNPKEKVHYLTDYQGDGVEPSVAPSASGSAS